MQKSRIEDVLGEGTVINEEGEIKNIFYDKLGVVYKNDKALYFDIYNKEFTTYKGIKVGDASELVLSRFKTPMIGNSYIVFFKGSNEVNIEKTHDYDFSILYNFSNDKISRIIISSKI